MPQPVREALRKTLLAIDPASPEVAARSTGWSEVLRHGFVPVDASVYEAFRAMETRMGLPAPGQRRAEDKP